MYMHLHITHSHTYIFHTPMHTHIYTVTHMTHNKICPTYTDTYPHMYTHEPSHIHMNTQSPTYTDITYMHMHICTYMKQVTHSHVHMYMLRVHRDTCEQSHNRHACT